MSKNFSLCPKVCWSQQKSAKYAEMRIATYTTRTFVKKKICSLFFRQMKVKENIFHTGFLNIS